MLAQNPGAGQLVPPLSRVHLIRGVKVPALAGMQLDSASRMIQAAELAVAQPAQSGGGSPTILSQVPRPDTVVTPGTILQLTFVGEPPPPRPPWIPWVVAVVVAALAGAALMRWLHNRAPRNLAPPRIRPEPHKDLGEPKIEASGNLMTGTEVSLVARVGDDLWTTTMSGPLVTAEDADSE